MNNNHYPLFIHRFFIFLVSFCLSFSPFSALAQSENLIQNPDASNGLGYWQIIQNGGDGWQAQSNRWGQGFGTSYRWNKKKQVIELASIPELKTALNQGKEILISATEQYSKTYCGVIPNRWWSNAVNPQKADQYYLTVRLKDVAGRILVEKTTGLLTVTAKQDCQWSAPEWHNAQAGFLIASQSQAQSASQIEFEHGGIAAEYWLGWYGPRMRHAELSWKILPPDPGEAGMMTLEGIDSNNDGVRDDVERFIAKELAAKPLSVKTQTLSVKTSQNLVAIGNQEVNPEAMKALAKEIDLQTDCEAYLNPAPNDFSDYLDAKKINTALLNTKDRIVAFIKANAKFPIDGFSSLSDGRAACLTLGVIK